MRALAGIVLLPAVALATPALASGTAGEATAFLSLGFTIGLAHAVEADHVAAVGAMLDRSAGRAAIIVRGAAWGAGHMLALLVICSTVLALGLTIPARLESALEAVVGLLIVALGVRVLWRLRRDRVHIHVHSHDGRRHIHLHSHAGERCVHDAAPHDHRHPQPDWRSLGGTLGVGVVHGAAGSAGLLVLTVAAADSAGAALAYLAVFGAGAMAGMTLLTAAASLPLGLMQGRAAWMRGATSAALGALALAVGGMLAYQSLVALGGAAV